MKPVITFALPTYNSSPILWLQLESLIRQETQYKWELLVCEDPSKNFCGEKYFDSYKQKLKEAGCINFKYIELDVWVPLAYKWKILAEFSNSENFILGSSDDYSPPDRIEKSHYYLQDYHKVDWDRCTFLNLNTLEKAIYTAKFDNTGIFAAIKTISVRQLKGPYPIRSVDGFIRNNQLDNSRYRIKELPKGVCTDGLNTISEERESLYKTHPNFSPSVKPLKNLIPQEILLKLENIKTK